MKGKGHQYALDVAAKKLPACEMVQLACARYLADLERSDLVFREDVAETYLKFFEQHLRHTIGQHAGKPFILLPWQAFILWNLYGWHWPNGSRRFNYSYISMARKQGKTTLMAGMALAALLLDQEQAAEIYSAATKRDQARILFDEARRMVLQSPLLRKHINAEKHTISAPSTHGKFTYLSSDSRTLDGTNVHLCLIDEYHSHPTDEVANVLRSGMQARQNPMHITITTAGLNRNVPCYKLQNTCREILKGLKNDDSFFCIIFEVDEAQQEDWTNPDHWHQSNPSLGATITLDALARQCQQAQNMGSSYETEFKTKHLNIWTDAAKTWIPDAQWKACEIPVQANHLPAECWAGLDLAAVSDLTALILIFPDQNGFHVRGHYWIPSETIRGVLSSNPAHFYAEMQHLPNVHVTDGNVTDFQSIRRFVTGSHITHLGQQNESGSLMHRHDVKAIAFDRHNSTQIAIDLVDDGAPLVPYGQGFVSMSPGAKQLEMLIRSGKIWHNGDPVLRWALANVELRTDPAGNIKPDKSKSSGKIDPIVALCMALGEYLRADPGISDEMLQVVSL